MSKKNKILVVVTGDLPNKSIGASTIVFYQFINYLLNKNNKVFVLSINLKKIRKKKIDNFLKSFNNSNVRLIETVYFKKFFDFNRYNILLKKIKTQELGNNTLKKINKIQPDKILALDITAASFSKQISSKNLYIWLGDLNFSTIWYHFYYNFKGLLKFYVYFFYIKILIKKWKSFYKETLINSKNISGTNSNIKALKKIGIISKYNPYPWPNFNKIINKEKNKVPSFIFFGNLNGLGSKSAINYLLNFIYPAYQRIWGNDGFIIYVCGSYKLPANFEKKIKKLKNLKLMGFYKDLNNLASSCHGCLFPIDVPVGNRSRVVTAMASGWPIIAHKNVSIGNPSLVSKKNCLLAKNATDFSYYSKMLYENKNLRKKITLNALKTYNLYFNPKKALIKFGNFIDE